MTIIDSALAILDKARAQIADVGLRPYDVSVRFVTWHGGPALGAPGQGTRVVTETAITVYGGRRPQVTVVLDRDVIAGSVLTRTLYKIDNITPPYTGGGTDASTLQPDATANPDELFYVLKGPGMPATGMLCKKVRDAFDSVFRYAVWVESTGQAA